MYRGQHISITGFQLVDAEDTVEQKDRASAIPQFATVAREQNAGYANWRIMRPGDPANMMYWPLDPNVPPSRGAATGSYSYAIPARKVPTGEFLPLDLPGFLAVDYEPLVIEEASPKDWIVLATVKHGDRRKLAFRSGNDPLLIADHRSLVAPDLSSIVHDGLGLTHDPIRKAGLHTAWEVREYVIPGTQASSWQQYQQGTVSGPPPGQPLYALSWVGDTAPDQTGLCNIGFGDRTGLFSHAIAGPFKPSFKEKHWLAETHDGSEITGALSTTAYFAGSGMPFTAPVEFQEQYYQNPADSTYEYKVFLWYDKKSQHAHPLGPREGLWRWFTRIPIGETPKCSPTKDYSTTDVNSNPRRTFAEDSRAIMHKKLISPGLYFSPRPNLMRGRIPGTVTTHV
jgi:hypothetical protein